MSAETQTDLQTPRIAADDLKARLESGDPVIVLDARAPKAWAEGDQRIRGDVRVDPEHFHADSSWPKDRLTAVYCT